MESVDATCLINKSTVMAFVEVLPAAPHSYELHEDRTELTLSDGSCGPSLILGPRAMTALRLGVPLTIMEVDGEGPARATPVDRRN